MKTRSIILIAAILVLLTSSNSCVSFNGGITGSKNYITRDFKIENFDKVDISAVAEVNYTQSTDGSASLQVYGSDNIVELVKVSVKNNTLTISMKKKNIKKSNLKITISSPNLQYIKSHGVGNFNIKDKLETTNLTIKNDGVGDIKINQIICTTLDVHTDGVGNVFLKGKADKVELISKGVGNINATDLEGRNVTAFADGVGNISCHATQAINAKVNGVGNISYKGNPTDKQIKKSGVGNIKQK